MTVFRTHALRRTAWLMAWLLACLMPVQATAVAWLRAAGPAHAHAPVAAPQRGELVDFRRASVAFGAEDATHGDAHASGARHHHAADDAGVQPVADAWSPVERDAGGDAPASLVAGFLSLSASAPRWSGADDAPEAFGLGAAWSPTATHLPRSERPPR